VVALFWLMDGRNLKDGAKYAFLAVLVTLPWLIFATWYFGSPVPHSITAKALTYRSPVSMEWIYVLWYIFAQRGSTGGSILIVALLGTGVAAVLSQQALRPLRIYLAWMVLYIAVFTFVQSGRFGWYYAPVMPVLFTLVVLGGAVWFEQTRRLSAMTRILQSNLRYVLAGTLFLALIVTSGMSVYASSQAAHRETSVERQIWQPLGRWIRENTASDATVALESIGGIGWYAERYIWDEGGLVSAKTYALNQDTPGGLNVMALLQTYHPDLFITWQPWELETLRSPEAQAWFDANYEFVESYTADSITWNLFQSRSSDRVRKIPAAD
jgi:hypothetical protein